MLAGVFGSRLVLRQRGCRRTRGNLLVAAILVMSCVSLDPVSTAVDSLAPGLDRLLINLMLFVVFLTTALFFSGRLPWTRRTVLFCPGVQVLVTVFAAIALTSCWALSEQGIPQYQEVLSKYTPSLHAAGYFYLAGNLQFAYCCIILSWSCFLEASCRADRLKCAFYLTSISSALMFFAGPFARVVALTTWWISGNKFILLGGVRLVVGSALQMGIIGFIVSLCIFGGAHLKVRQQEQQILQRKIERLNPLWEVLAAAAPGTKFYRRSRIERGVDFFLRDTRFWGLIHKGVILLICGSRHRRFCLDTGTAVCRA